MCVCVRACMCVHVYVHVCVYVMYKCVHSMCFNFDVQYTLFAEVPRVTLSANQVRSRVGDSIVLNCTVPGYPYPHVVWSRVDNQRLPFNVVVQEFREERVWMMTLMVSGPSYFGDYDCSAENFLGKSVQVATIEGDKCVCVYVCVCVCVHVCVCVCVCV